MIRRRPARTVAARWLFRLAFATFVVWSGSTAALAETVLPALARHEDQARFRVTAFATGLAYPTSMATLADGSLLVATSDGGTDWQANSLFASPRGALVRLVDADGDGVADEPPQTMAADLPGLVTSVRRVGDLVFALSSKAGQETVTILRTGASAVAPLTAAGRLSFTFSAGFEHTTYALAARATPDGDVALYFNTGSRQNSISTPADVRVDIAVGDGAAFEGSGSRSLAADSISRVIVRDAGTSLTVSAPEQIARGLRNAAGMVFDDAGDLWLQDNGIDMEGNRGVSFSADELNRVHAADVGVSVPTFGFADTYVRYSDGQTVGPTEGVTLPLAAFLPIDGRKSEGAVELAFAPGTFPADFAGGLFVPFSGVFNRGGPANDENPVVFVDPATGDRFHFIESGVMGHPNGLLAADSGLFITDLNPTGRFGDPIATDGAALTLNGIPADRAGVIYLVSPTVAPVPEPSTWAMAVAAFACGSVAMARRRGPWPAAAPR